MSFAKWTVVGTVMALVVSGASAAQVGQFAGSGDIGIDVEYVTLCNYQGALQIGIQPLDQDNTHWWLVAVSEISGLLYGEPGETGVWVNGDIAGEGDYFSCSYPGANSYVLVAARAAQQSVYPAFEIKLYLDVNEDGVKQSGDTLQETRIVYLF